MTQSNESIIPRFIVGMPRAGTTWVCQALNTQHDVAAFGETMFWGKSFVSPDAEGYYDALTLRRVKAALLTKPFESTLAIPGPGPMQRLTRADLPGIFEACFAALGNRATPPEVFGKIAEAIAEAEGKTHWVEKTPHHLLSAQRILHYLPNARFVIMIREPYSFMLSYKHQRGHENTAASRVRFARRYHPLGCTLVWRNSWRAARQLAETLPEQALIIPLEQVQTDPTAVIRRIQTFFGLPADSHAPEVVYKVNSAFNQEPRPRLADADIAWMNRVAGSAIAEAGYQPLHAPKNNTLALWRSSLDLPGWSIRLLRDTRRTTAGSLRRHLWRWLAPHRSQQR